jgi:hypothetical protein
MRTGISTVIIPKLNEKPSAFGKGRGELSYIAGLISMPVRQTCRLLAQYCARGQEVCLSPFFGERTKATDCFRALETRGKTHKLLSR